MNPTLKKIMTGATITVLSTAIVTGAIFVRDVTLKLQAISAKLAVHDAQLAEHKEAAGACVSRAEFEEEKRQHAHWTAAVILRLDERNQELDKRLKRMEDKMDTILTRQR